MSSLSGRGGLAGVAAVALIAKPQLAVGAGIGLALAALRGTGTARRMLLVGAAGSAAVVGLATLALPQWWPVWSASVAPQRLAHPATLASALSELIGPAGGWLALGLVVAAGALIALRFRPGGDASLAAWLALGVAGAAYAWSYDHLLLLVPLILGAGAVARRDAAAAIRLVRAGTLVLLLASPVLYGLAVLRHRESFSAIVPLAFFVAIVVSCWPVRND